MSLKSRNRKLPANCTEEDELRPVDDLARDPSVERVAHALRTGMCLDDDAFDRFLPYDWRPASGQHWTPLVVIQRVAAWIEELGVKTVVDLGSGVGKFCVAGALASRCEFTGIEQRLRLVEAARGLAQRFDVDDRVRFVHGTLGQCPLPGADAYYLFNPFGENLLDADESLGHDVELSDERYERDVAFMEAFFERARVGTYILKYNGFGGYMPPTYEPILLDRQMPNVLRVWRKTRPSRGATRTR